MATNSTEGFPEFDFSETLDAIIEPLLNTCQLSVAKLSKIDQDIYMVNCLYHIQTVMVPYDFTQQKRDNVTARMNDLLDDIAQEEYNKLVEQAGLTRIKETLAKKDAEVCIIMETNLRRIKQLFYRRPCPPCLTWMQNHLRKPCLNLILSLY